MTTPEHLKPFLELLLAEGFRPTIEGAEEADGDGSDAFLLFKYEGSKFTLQPELPDPTFFLMKHAYQAQPHPLAVLLRIANDLNHGCKVVKTLVEPDGGVGFSFEAFVDDVAAAGPLLLKGLGALSWTSSQFFDRLEKEGGGEDPGQGGDSKAGKLVKDKEYVN